MRRRVFTISAGVSAVIFFIAGSIWVCSLFAEPTLARQWTDLQALRYHAVSVNAIGGRLMIWEQTITSSKGPSFLPSQHGGASWSWIFWPPPNQAQPPSVWGWSVYIHSASGVSRIGNGVNITGTMQLVMTGIRLVAVMGAAFVVPGLWVISRFVRSRRHLRGKCPVCGYDLRATPEAEGKLLERCPECGTGSAEKAEG